jgi:hypothetical protein
LITWSGDYPSELPGSGNKRLHACDAANTYGP